MARPFLTVAALAILAGGLVAAAVAHAPTQPMVWMVAYLVLVVGLVQVALGLGQTLLPRTMPSTGFRVGECVLFNVGNVGVIAGTLLLSPMWVAVGTVVFIASLVMFWVGLRGTSGGWLVHALRALLVITCGGALVGLVLSFITTSP